MTRGIAYARSRAKRLLSHFGVRRASDIVLDAIARELGAEIVIGTLDGADAQLVRDRGRITILISSRIRHAGERRFLAAHELGHLLLGHPSPPASELLTPLLRAAGSVRTQAHENEASAFASELLMPEEQVRARCQVTPVDLQVPREIAQEFSVSLLTSAIRVTELSGERCAAVLSAGGHVRWDARSASFPGRIARGHLARSSVAYAHFAGGELDERRQLVPADAWLSIRSDVEIVEQATVSLEHGTVLSMLWIPESAAQRLARAA